MMSFINSDVLIAVLSAVGTLGGVYLKYLLDKRRKAASDPMLEAQETDMQVMNKLHEVVDRVDCDRAYIIEFHNGGKFYSGRSMQKFSMTYEVVRPGVSHEQTNYQNILMSSYIDYVSIAAANNDFILVNDSEMIEDNRMKSEMMAKGIESMMAKLIRSIDGRIVGMLITNFVKHKKHFTDADVLYVSHCAEVLAGYLL